MGNFIDRIRLTGLSLKPVTHDYCSTTDYSTASEVREPAVTYGNATPTTHASVIQATINQIQQRNTNKQFNDKHSIVGEPISTTPE